MKTRKNIYIVIASILILLNLLVDIAEFETIKSPTENTAATIGYFIGSHFLLIFGLFLLRIAYKLQKKMKKKEVQEMINRIGNS